MPKIAPHLTSFGLRIANAWLLQDAAGQKFLIDTGHALERIPLIAQLFAAGVRIPGDLTAILLTHRHSDHAGNAAFLRKRFGARVYCHENDAAPLRGQTLPQPMRRDEPTARAVGKQRIHEKLFAAYEDRAPAFCEIDGTYTEGLWRWGFHVTEVPGHTEGSVLLYHEPTRTLFTGDAILTGTPLLRFFRRANPKNVHALRELQMADPAYSQDADASRLAVRRFLKRLPPTHFLCPGHGVPLAEGDSAETRLGRLLARTQ
jgi:glyoxylase-like metal-dependent hydrolase (beta-lactamase superfamily II)